MLATKIQGIWAGKHWNRKVPKKKKQSGFASISFTVIEEFDTQLKLTNGRREYPVSPPTRSSSSELAANKKAELHKAMMIPSIGEPSNET